jgi:hypothetical protein
MGSLRDLKKQDSEELSEELIDITCGGILDEIKGAELFKETGLRGILDYVITLMEGTGGINGIYEDSLGRGPKRKSQG